MRQRFISPHCSVLVRMAVLTGVFLMLASACAADSTRLENWMGCVSNGAAEFQYPKGPRGVYKHGFRVLNDCAAEWQKFYGIRFEVQLPVKFGNMVQPKQPNMDFEGGPIRITGTEARFLTVIEPYEKESVIQSATATKPDSLRVQLKDGWPLEIPIIRFDGDGTGIEAGLVESQNGRMLRSESTRSNGNL